MILYDGHSRILVDADEQIDFGILVNRAISYEAIDAKRITEISISLEDGKSIGSLLGACDNKAGSFVETSMTRARITIIGDE